MASKGGTNPPPERLVPRTIKGGLLLASLGFLVEGVFELPKLKRAVTQPPSVPGEAKVIEHFVLQHIAFPVLASFVIFSPLSLGLLFSSRLFRLFLSGSALVVAIPETIVSLRRDGDLFRRYPFDVRSKTLRALEQVPVRSQRINFLQAGHLLLNHWLFAGVMIALCLRPVWLRTFAGPHTGGKQRLEEAA